MHFVRWTALMIAFSFPALLACDWGAPGSSLRWSQSVRSWDAVDDGTCLMIGTYTFALNTTTPPFKGSSSLRIRPEFSDQREFLPTNVDLNWYRNDVLFYSQQYDLKNGSGRLKEEQPNFWTYSAGDEIDYEICAAGGDIPIHSTISLSLRYKFDKLQAP